LQDCDVADAPFNYPHSRSHDLPSLVQVLDEQHLIARFVVNEIVHERTRHGQAESSWPKSLFFSHGQMSHGIVVTTHNLRMAEFVDVEPLARVGDAVHEQSLCPNARDADLAIGVEFAT